jgi:hypothetical protein
MWPQPRNHARGDGADTVTKYVDPSLQLNLGLWILFAGATVLLCARVWVKITRRHGLWYDDYILITSWVSTSSLLTSEHWLMLGFAARPSRQQCPHLPRICDWLRHAESYKVGRPDAYTHQYHFLRYPHWPSMDENGLWCDPPQARKQVAAIRPLVLHRHHERVHARKGSVAVGATVR